MSLELVPGAWVRLRDAPDWGAGQVQSVVGHRVTINFEHAGKCLIDGSVAILEPALAPTLECDNRAGSRASRS